MADYELDHIIPLCLGGSNDRTNLQLQLWPDARRKDEMEWTLCDAVRNHEMTCAEARAEMLEWNR